MVSIVNARRHGGRRIIQAVTASALALVALGLAIWLLARLAPQWIVDAGLAGPWA